MRKNAVLDLMVTNLRELIGNVKTGGSLGCSNHGLLELTVMRNIGQKRSEVRLLNCRKTDFQLSKEIVSGIPWGTALRYYTKQSLQLRGFLLSLFLFCYLIFLFNLFTFSVFFLWHASPLKSL